MPSSRSESQRKAEPCARRCARVPSVEPPSMMRNSYSSFFCERTEATVAAIFAPLLNVGVMSDISGGFITNQGRGGWRRDTLHDLPPETKPIVRRLTVSGGFERIRGM